MKQSGTTTVVLAVLLLGTIAGCTSTGYEQRSRQQSVSHDSAITAGVKTAIVNDPTLQFAEVSVETHQGVVQLSGFVSSAENVATASSVARTVKGVRSVKNDLRLK